MLILERGLVPVLGRLGRLPHCGLVAATHGARGLPVLRRGARGLLLPHDVRLPCGLLSDCDVASRGLRLRRDSAHGSATSDGREGTLRALRLLPASEHRAARRRALRKVHLVAEHAEALLLLAPGLLGLGHGFTVVRIVVLVALAPPRLSGPIELVLRCRRETTCPSVFEVIGLFGTGGVGRIRPGGDHSEPGLLPRGRLGSFTLALRAIRRVRRFSPALEFQFFGGK